LWRKNERYKLTAIERERRETPREMKHARVIGREGGRREREI
jgi:hypothetical protein